MLRGNIISKFTVRFTLYKVWVPLEVEAYIKRQFVWIGGEVNC